MLCKGHSHFFGIATRIAAVRKTPWQRGCCGRRNRTSLKKNNPVFEPNKQVQKSHSAFEISNLSSVFKESEAIFLSPNPRHELSYPAKFQKTIEKYGVFFLWNYEGKWANLLNFSQNSRCSHDEEITTKTWKMFEVCRKSPVQSEHEWYFTPTTPKRAIQPTPIPK